MPTIAFAGSKLLSVTVSGYMRPCAYEHKNSGCENRAAMFLTSGPHGIGNSAHKLARASNGRPWYLLLKGQNAALLFPGGANLEGRPEQNSKFGLEGW